MKKSFSNTKAVIVLLLFVTFSALAQGDGPRAQLLSPTGVWGINPKWVSLSQNFLPSGILVKNAEINIDVFPTTAFHTFGIGGKFAMVQFMVNPGSANGVVTSDNTMLPISKLSTSASGFADGMLTFKMGLIGAPALNLNKFMKHTPAFSMTGYVRWWYSGTYDSKKPLNLGSNRSTFEFGLPMAIPFGNNPKRATWLEVNPGVRFYTANNDPTMITMADKSQQKPLYMLENHLTHNFADKFWAGVDLRYQVGGDLELDGVNQNNKVNVLGGGVEAGYQILPYLSANAGYGTILAGDNGAKSDMFRLSIIFTYLNMNKLKTQTN